MAAKIHARTEAKRVDLLPEDALDEAILEEVAEVAVPDFGLVHDVDVVPAMLGPLLDVRLIGAYFSAQSSLSLAVRSIFSNTAARDLGATLLEDISRNNVVRSQLQLGGALAASFRTYVRSYDAAIRESADGASSM